MFKEVNGKPRIMNVTDAPHILSSRSVKNVMLDFILSMFPLVIFGVYAYGLRVISILVISCVSSVLSEQLVCRIKGKRAQIGNFSSICTGMMICCMVPPTVPLWFPAAVGFVSVALLRELFGGLGKSIFNHVAFAILAVRSVFPGTGGNVCPFGNHLPVLSFKGFMPAADLAEDPSLKDLMLGNVNFEIGCLSALLIIFCALNLLLRHTVNAASPFSIMASMTLLSYIFPQGASRFGSAAETLLCGTFLFASFFIASDYASSPLTVPGKIIYGITVGTVCFTARRIASASEAILISICAADLLVPLIDRLTTVSRITHAKHKKIA